MQKKKRPTYSREFRQRAVELSSEKSVQEVASELGISTSSIIRWRAELGESPVRKTKGSLTAREMKQRLAELEKENAMLKKEKKMAEMEREILKKATVFFAKENE